MTLGRPPVDERLQRLITLGREHYNAREFDKAERYLSEVVRDHQDFADLFNMLGVIYHDRGRFPEAERSFEEALRINPNYTEAALNLAVTYNDLGKYGQAREVYTRAIVRSRGEPRSLDPFVRGKLANMHADLASAYEGVGLYPEAVREYGRALELCPTFVDLRTRLAQLHRDTGDAAAALREFEIVKTINPRYAPARVSLGLTLHAAGRTDEAAREWEAALQADPTNRTARMCLQMVREPAESSRPAEGSTPPPASESLDGILDGVLDESK